jgi:cytochrome c-type biogenesis protein CcmH
VTRAILAILPLAVALQASAGDLDQRTEALAAQLRCVVCQNQTIADSSAPLALQLKGEVRRQLAAGRSEAQVTEFLTQRYGDFVLYRPPFKPSTWLLWAGPALLLAAGIALLARIVRRAAGLPEEEHP